MGSEEGESKRRIAPVKQQQRQQQKYRKSVFQNPRIIQINCKKHPFFGTGSILLHFWVAKLASGPVCSYESRHLILTIDGDLHELLASLEVVFFTERSSES